MAPMPKVLTAADLYAPATPTEVNAALRALTGERDRDRNPLLSRALTDTERKALRVHHASLERYTARGEKAAKADAILSMMQGLGGPTLSREEALELTHQHVKVCDDLPLWAVLRACDRFARGQVEAEEIGAKSMDPNYRPTTAALHRVAAKLAEPVLNTRYRIGEALRGVVALAPPRLTEEQRAANAERMKGIAAGLARGVAERDLAERTASSVRRSQEARAASAAAIEREYRAAGLSAPAWNGDMPPASLSLLLSLGWRIEDGQRGERVLIEPRKSNAGPTPKRPQNDLNDAIPF